MTRADRINRVVTKATARGKELHIVLWDYETSFPVREAKMDRRGKATLVRRSRTEPWWEVDDADRFVLKTRS